MKVAITSVVIILAIVAFLTLHRIEAVRVVSLSTSQLKVINPPSYLAAAEFGIFAAPAVIVLLLGRAGLKGKSILAYAAWALVMGGLAACFASTDSIFIDKNTNTITMDSLYGVFHMVIPAEQLQYATLETDEGAYRIVLVLQGGRRESLSTFSDRSGQSEAADAINSFLERKSRP